MKLNITQLRTPKKKIKEHTIPFINVHNLGVTKIFHAIKSNLSILLKRPKMKNLVDEKQLQKK